jgi:hypothetical protein
MTHLHIVGHFAWFREDKNGCDEMDMMQSLGESALISPAQFETKT